MLLLASAVVVTALGGCPKPVHHVKHKPDAPLCSCNTEPRTIVLQASEPTPEPADLTVVRYYVPLTTDISYEPAPEDTHISWGGVGGWVSFGGYTPASAVQIKCPELDPSSLGAGLTLLAGGIAVLRSGKRL